MFSLVICTVLYIIITLVLTGMVDYRELAVGDPLSFVFEKVGLHWISGIVAASAVVAIASVLLVFQLGQPRIWMSMSRDGLLPKRFSKVHPKFKTPAFATVVTGFLVAIPALFMNLKEVTDLASIGTLFAFVIVCGGILKLDDEKHFVEGQFKVPYYNAKYSVPGLLIAILITLQLLNPGGLSNIFALHSLEDFFQRIPTFAFIIVALLLAIESFRKNLSLLPVLGLLANFYLMTELGISNWMFFFFWLAGGLIVYFLYGVKHSKLRK